MRLSSLLLIALGATAGCRTTTLPSGAAYSGAPLESLAQGANESASEGANESANEAAPSEPPTSDSNPGAGPSESSTAKTPVPAGPDDRRRLLAAIPLAAMGIASAGMGGFLMGWGLGACDSGETTCATRVALPIVGALSIAAGALPMAFGISLLAPAAPALKTGQASPWPEVVVGPSAASAKWRF
jgi:hypothetical protein